MDTVRSAYKILTGKSIQMRSLGGLRREDNIRIDLKDTRVCANTKNCIGSVQNKDYWRAFVNAALDLRIT